MNVIEAIHRRRSIRAYRSDPVERPVLEDILWAAAQAPTPPVSGDKPWTFCIFEGIDRIDGYGVRAKDYAQGHQPPGRPWTWADRPEFRVFWGAPVLLLICARSGNPETAFDCCRAGQNVLLAAHHHGLGSCWVGAPMPWLRSAVSLQSWGCRRASNPPWRSCCRYAAESPRGQPRPRPDVLWCDADDTRLRSRAEGYVVL